MTVEVGLAKVEYEACGSRKEVCILLTRVFVDSSTSLNNVEVYEEVYTLAKTEGVEETCTCTELPVLGVTSKTECAKLSVRNKIVETGLFVTVDRLEHVPESVYMEEVLIPLLNGATNIGLVVCTVLDTTVTSAETEGRGKPLTNVCVYCETADVEVHLGTNGSVCTGTNTDEPVVPEFVGLIRTANNVSVLVTVAILLCRSIEGESEETCYCKCSENSFDTFHNIAIII